MIGDMPNRAAHIVGVALAVILSAPAGAQNQLTGRAVLPAATFAPGPTSGTLIGSGPINGQPVPFVNQQPVQGFSAIRAVGDGSYWAMSDNGFGSIENSADYRLRVYHIRPDFKTASGGTGAVAVEGYIELRDPDQKIPFAIVNQFTTERNLTGGDFDIEAMQQAPDGSLWFGDEFGPFLLHTDSTGKVLEAPFQLPDFDNPGKFIRAPQNPYNEEGSAIRIMNAFRAHALANGNTRTPVFSPWDVMLADNNLATVVEDRAAPPAGSGLQPASSEIFNVTSMKNAGFPVVVWTVNDKARMLELMRLGVNGIISDRSDLLLEAVREFDANNDGTPGDFIGPDGLIDIAKFDAQGHRGSRNLRPENTLPAMEVALDNLMTTLETDTGISADGVPLLSHDPHLQTGKCRLASGEPYEVDDEVLIKDLTVAAIQSQFICDGLIRGNPQTNDRSLSPVSVAFATQSALADPYVPPTLQKLFAFVTYYENYYRTGAGSSHPQAGLRWRNAQRVRFNIETKINPRQQFASRTVGPNPFADAVAASIVANNLQQRADIQSFEFRTLLRVQSQYPSIRTVYLFGDFPIYANPAIPGSDDSTNLQDEFGANTPWLAGLYWPYRQTALSNPFRSATTGGFEGMAISADQTKLLPLLERPLAGGQPNTLLIHEFNLASKQYTGVRYGYPLDPRGTNIGDYIMFNNTDGLVIEREGSQGNLNGFKAIYEVKLRRPGDNVGKRLAVDLLNINDPNGISLPAPAGDVGLGARFAFPFTTIEDVFVIDSTHIGVLNDNNYPFSIGRHIGTGQPDDNEFIIIQLDRPLRLGR